MNWYLILQFHLINFLIINPIQSIMINVIMELFVKNQIQAISVLKNKYNINILYFLKLLLKNLEDFLIEFFLYFHFLYLS